MQIEELDQKIRNASPLELPSVLEEAELFDKKQTKEVVDEVYKEFDKGGSLEEEVLIPVCLSIADGFLECTKATRKLRKKGLTASRIVQECRAFSYDNPGEMHVIPNGYVEYKNIRESTKQDFDEYAKNERPAYSRELYEDKKALNTYREEAFKNNGGTINAVDEYTGEKNIYKEQAHPDARRNIQDYKHRNQANVDHIVPLKQIHEKFKGNYALSDEDIKNIANKDYNFALTAAHINNGTGAVGQGFKGDKTNKEFVDDQNRREQAGLPNQGLSDETKARLLETEKEATHEINRNANVAIGKNITGTGTGDTKMIWEKTSANALNQSKDYLVGNVILFAIKPLYYELSDIFKNGMKEGVGAETTRQAIAIRFGRIKDFVVSNAVYFIGDNVWGFVKGFVSSLIEGFISLFVGVFKQVLKLIKEGIRIFTQAGKVLFGKEAKQMSHAQKGDAIIKIIGSSVIAICGIGMEALMNKIGIPDGVSVVLSTMFSGIASALFLYLMDQLDLFSVKAEKRYARIEEIFDARINDIRSARDAFNDAALETMREQRVRFDAIIGEINAAIEGDNIVGINNGLYKMAELMNVDLPYHNTPEFVVYMDTVNTIEL